MSRRSRAPSLTKLMPSVITFSPTRLLFLLAAVKATGSSGVAPRKTVRSAGVAAKTWLMRWATLDGSVIALRPIFGTVTLGTVTLVVVVVFGSVGTLGTGSD